MAACITDATEEGLQEFTLATKEPQEGESGAPTRVTVTDPPRPMRTPQNAAPQASKAQGKYYLLRKYLLQQELDTVPPLRWPLSRLTTRSCPLSLSKVFMTEKRKAREDARKKAEEDALEEKRREEEEAQVSLPLRPANSAPLPLSPCRDAWRANLPPSLCAPFSMPRKPRKS